MKSARRNMIRLAAVGLCAAVVGCGARVAPAPVGGSTSSKADKARKDAEALALNGVTGGATAQARAVPEALVRHDADFNVVIGQTKSGSAVKGATPPVPGAQSAPGAAPAPSPSPAPAPVAKGPPGPRSTPRSGWVIRERVVSTCPNTETEAEEDVLAQACAIVERKLAALDPPLHHAPSLGEVKAEFLRKDSRLVRPPDKIEMEAVTTYAPSIQNPVYVEYDVEVTADQVRELRAQERISAGMRVVGALIAVALAGFLFLRADEWTKGYLTRWLALVAVTVAGGVAAALIFV